MWRSGRAVANTVRAAVDPHVVHRPGTSSGRHEFARPFPSIILADVLRAAEAFLEVEKDDAPPVHARRCGLSCRDPRVEQRPRCHSLPSSGRAALKSWKLRGALVGLVVTRSKTLETQDCGLVEHAVEEKGLRVVRQHHPPCPRGTARSLLRRR